ncbi:MAG: glycosyltransferase family 4 protein [Planctomycetota bacterium]
MSGAEPAPALVLVANTRLPSQRAQALQVLHAAAGFAAAGRPTTVLHALRRDTQVMPRAELLAQYGVDAALPLEIRGLPCVDAIDRVPRRLQYVPARVQEWTFARSAARAIRRDFAGARVLSREIETADRLRGRPGLFLEIHRVPGGRIRRAALRRAAASAAGVIAISGGVREDLESLGVDPGAILVEHDAFDGARFAAMPNREEARRELSIPAERPLVVYTGGLLAWKGVDVLIEASRTLPDVYFLIAGGMDQDVAAARGQAAGLDNVRLIGFQPPGCMPTLLAAADLGVVPNRSQPAISSRYTSPLKVFEAMAAGLPLVVSDLPSLRDILGDHQALFVAPDDPRALAAGIQQLFADPVRRRNLGQALGQARDHHTFAARAGRILEWMDRRVVRLP